MKPNIHPENYKDVKVSCRCGAEYPMRLVMDRDHLLLDVCSNCHSFYTKTQKIATDVGRVKRFYDQYGDAESDRESK